MTNKQTAFIYLGIGIRKKIIPGENYLRIRKLEKNPKFVMVELKIIFFSVSYILFLLKFIVTIILYTKLFDIFYTQKKRKLQIDNFNKSLLPTNGTPYI